MVHWVRRGQGLQHVLMLWREQCVRGGVSTCGCGCGCWCGCNCEMWGLEDAGISVGGRVSGCGAEQRGWVWPCLWACELIWGWVKYIVLRVPGTCGSPQSLIVPPCLLRRRTCVHLHAQQQCSASICPADALELLFLFLKETRPHFPSATRLPVAYTLDDVPRRCPVMHQFPIDVVCYLCPYRPDVLKALM